MEIAAAEVEFSSIRASGAGGQHVNKVSSAVHLRFDIRRSSLPYDIQQRLLALHDSRINTDAVVVIKAQRYRSQQQNKDEALARLQALILRACAVQKPRRASKPSRSAQRKRLDSKKKRSRLKELRGRID